MSTEEKTLTIPKAPVLHQSENYAFLRAEGIRYIEKLSNKLWTDYNTHDPGIAIMELLCYAITDLGYRTSFRLEDILALDPRNAYNTRNFYTAKEILPVN